MNLGGKVQIGRRLKFLGRLLVVTFLMATVLGALSGAMSEAAWAEDAEQRPDYWIQVSPAKLELGELKPGQTTTTTFEVQNIGRKDFNFSLLVSPYSVVNEAYDADYATETQYNDIAQWITLSKYEGTVEPNSVYEITATVHVPKDVPAGGQYAVILARLEVPEEDDETAVSITRQVGVVVYSSVAGNTRHGGKVLENKVDGLLFAPPISASSLIENTGNTHVEATYVLQVFPLFGDEEVYTNEDEPEKRTILPETKRFNTISWENSPRLGLFKVRQTVKILEETSVTEKVVLICPIWFMFILILLLFCVVFWIVSRIRGRSKERESERE